MIDLDVLLRRVGFGLFGLWLILAIAILAYGVYKFGWIGWMMVATIVSIPFIGYLIEKLIERLDP